MFRVHNEEELKQLKELIAMAQEGSVPVRYPLDIYRTQHRMTAIEFASEIVRYTYVDEAGRIVRESSEGPGFDVRQKAAEAERHFKEFYSEE